MSNYFRGTLQPPTGKFLYQAECVDAINAHREHLTRRGIVSLPTGTGKTIIFARYAKDETGRVLILTHLDQITKQTVEKLAFVCEPDEKKRSQWAAANVGVVKGPLRQWDRKYTVASIQSVGTERRVSECPRDFSLVIVDEAHHVVAETYQRILNHVGAFKKSGPFVLGVTATPFRGDKKGLGDTFERVLFKREIIEMIAAGVLCNLVGKRVVLEGVDLDKAKVRKGKDGERDFSDKSLAELMVDSPPQIAGAWQDLALDRRGLVFAPSVALSQQIAAELNTLGIKAEHVDGDTPPDSRAETLKRLEDGDTRAVANCGVFTEGADLPYVDVVMVARQTMSMPFYQQMVGRGTRTHPEKKDCLIIDVVGNSERHSLQCLEDLAGITRKALDDRKGDVLQAVATAQDQGELSILEGRRLAFDVDLFTKSDVVWMHPEGSHKHFLRPLEESVALIFPHGDGVAVLVGSGKPWDPIAVPWSVEPDYPAAMALVDGLAKTIGTEKLDRKKLWWRKKPASKGQLGILRNSGMAFKVDGLTRGDASDLIARYQARETYNAWKRGRVGRREEFIDEIKRRRDQPQARHGRHQNVSRRKASGDVDSKAHNGSGQRRFRGL